jgi:hypothetical protein
MQYPQAGEPAYPPLLHTFDAMTGEPIIVYAEYIAYYFNYVAQILSIHPSTKTWGGGKKKRAKTHKKSNHNKRNHKKRKQSRRQ